MVKVYTQIHLKALFWYMRKRVHMCVSMTCTCMYTHTYTRTQEKHSVSKELALVEHQDFWPEKRYLNLTTPKEKRLVKIWIPQIWIGSNLTTSNFVLFQIWTFQIFIGSNLTTELAAINSTCRRRLVDTEAQKPNIRGDKTCVHAVISSVYKCPMALWKSACAYACCDKWRIHVHHGAVACMYVHMHAVVNGICKCPCMHVARYPFGDRNSTRFR